MINITRMVIVSLVIGFGQIAGLAADVVEPTEKDPRYELSDLRRGEDNSLLFNFKRTKKANGYVTVFMKGKSNNNIVSISATISPDVAEDIVSLRSFIPSNSTAPINLEIYLVTLHTVGDKQYLYSMVSNPVRIGNPGEPTKPRAWTTQEQQGLAEYLAKPPTTIKRYEVNIDVPASSVKVPLTAKLTKGVKLQACYTSKWSPITALSENADGSVFVRWDDWGATFDCNMLRDELIIEKNVLARLPKHPESKFPKVPASLSAAPSVDAANAKPLKAYPVSIEVPTDSQFVPVDAKLKEATKLQACYSGAWHPITFLSHASDGTLLIRWDKYGPSFDCRMKRDELIIKKALLRSSKGETPKSNELRMWTDATGKFKVKATLIARSENSVTLVTEAGKTIELPVTRLSQADQSYLSTLSSASDNPFE